MKNQKEAAIQSILDNAEIFCNLSDEIWEYAELSLKEFKSAEKYCEVLEELGFSVEKNVCGIETAFLGKYGEGHPVIGILGEFDALSGLSQLGGLTVKAEKEKGGNGHGCGHNMLGAGAFAAAYGVKKYLENTKIGGTVVFFGTPGEEGGAGKAFMAKEGLWHSLDCALTWHPDDVNEVATGTCNSCIQSLYKFKGIASHAAGDPEYGRSALDAVELMNVGVQFLREHTKSDARIHYSIINSGGASPNVVQSEASVLYMVRSISVKDALELQKRVDKIASGAAMMTETSFEKVFIDGCSNTVPNHTLEKVLYDNFKILGVPSYTESEIEFASTLKKTYGERDTLPGIAAKKDYAASEYVKEMSCDGKKAMNDFLCPFYDGYIFEAGSTDVGDVSWQTPTAQIHVACFPSGAPGHSWQNVSCGKTSIGHKGLLKAGCVLAAAAVDIIENGKILTDAQNEYKVAAGGGYTCPIPDGEFAKAIEI